MSQALSDSPAVVGGERELLRAPGRIGERLSVLPGLFFDRQRQQGVTRQPVAAVVDGDPEDPGLQCGASAEAPEVTVDTKEDLLGEVRRLFTVARKPQGQVVDHVPETLVDLVEGVGIPGPVTLSQIDVEVEIVNRGVDCGDPQRIPPRSVCASSLVSWTVEGPEKFPASRATSELEGSIL